MKWKDHDKSFNSWINIKRHSVRMNQYFPVQYKHSGGNVNVELNLQWPI